MGWFRDFNLKRKVAGVMSERSALDAGMTAEDVAAVVREPVDAVSKLLDIMLATGFAVKDAGSDGMARYRLNREQATVAKVYKALDPWGGSESVGGYQMVFRTHEDGRWEAQVQDLPGMPFLGSSKQEATQNALAMAHKLAPKDTNVEGRS